MDYPKQPTVISFCPGIRGLERGIERVIGKLSVASYVEIEAIIIANLVAGMESGILDPAPIWTDAKTFDARPFRGKVHGIIGGYPCPGESFAGLREGHLYEGFIWPYIRRSIKSANPLWCFFENVEGHLSGTYPIVQRSLHNMGFSIEAGLFSAEEVGSPQTRRRTFILAVANSYLHRLRTIPGSHREATGPFEGKTRQQHWQWLRNEFEHSGSAMEGQLANTCSERLQGMQPRLVQGERQRVSGSATECSEEELSEVVYKYRQPSFYDFPLGQGYEQWEWEHPRQIEPKMELTINGYNFHEDLVRAIGNSVVEQTAELAWITLWKKIIQA